MIIVKSLGLCQYQDILQQMQTFTKYRTSNTPDELWQLEHYQVFTLGQAGDEKHILNPGNIPIMNSDRGGQVTYHGPGQLIIYLLCDLSRKKLTIRNVINSIQNSVIDLLANYNITATGDLKNPGVYVDDAKICAIGLKVHRGCLYHGLSLNVNVDLEPFSRINPCGRKDLIVTQLSALGIKEDFNIVTNILTANLMNYLSFGPR